MTVPWGAVAQRKEVWGKRGNMDHSNSWRHFLDPRGATCLLGRYGKGAPFLAAVGGASVRLWKNSSLWRQLEALV